MAIGVTGTVGQVPRVQRRGGQQRREAAGRHPAPPVAGARQVRQHGAVGAERLTADGRDAADPVRPHQDQLDPARHGHQAQDQADDEQRDGGAALREQEHARAGTGSGCCRPWPARWCAPSPGSEDAGHPMGGAEAHVHPGHRRQQLPRQESIRSSSFPISDVDGLRDRRSQLTGTTEWAPRTVLHSWKYRHLRSQPEHIRSGSDPPEAAQGRSTNQRNQPLPRKESSCVRALHVELAVALIWERRRADGHRLTDSSTMPGSPAHGASSSGLPLPDANATATGRGNLPWGYAGIGSGAESLA